MAFVLILLTILSNDILNLCHGKVLKSGVENNQIQTSSRIKDYGTLDHSIFLKSLRAGNHDKNGNNEYYFQLTIIGMLDLESEHLLDFKDKQKIVQNYKDFGHLELPAFTNYLEDSKGKNLIKTQVKGDDIRELVRRVMNELKHNKDQSIPENLVGIMIRISLYEKEKRYFFLDNDSLVGELDYFPIPFSSFEKKLYEDSQLNLNDSKGLNVMLEVKYDKNIVSEI